MHFVVQTNHAFNSNNDKLRRVLGWPTTKRVLGFGNVLKAVNIYPLPLHCSKIGITVLFDIGILEAV